MMDMGYPVYLIDLLAKHYRKQLAKVKMAGALSEWLKIVLRKESDKVVSFLRTGSASKSHFRAKKVQSPFEMGPEMAVSGENGGPNFRYWLRNPQKALPSAEPGRLTYFASKSVRASRW